MAKDEWRTTLIAPAIDENGRSTQVAAGMITNRDGPPRIAVRIGSTGPVAVLQPEAAAELIGHLRGLLAEKLGEDD